MGDLTVEDANGVVRARLGMIGTTQSPDYGLKVTSSDGATVIIDGTSDIFKITATGVLNTSGAGTGTATASVLLGITATNIPTNLVWEEFNDAGTGFNAAEISNAMVVTAAGAVAFLYEGWAELNGTSNVVVIVRTTATTAGAGGRVGNYRYYTLQEAAF